MAAVIRMKLIDLLNILSFSDQRAVIPSKSKLQSRTIQHQKTTGPRQLIDEADLRAIHKFLKNGNVTRRDLEFELNMSGAAVLRRLEMLREKGFVEHLPGNQYGLIEEAKGRF